MLVLQHSKVMRPNLISEDLGAEKIDPVVLDDLFPNPLSADPLSLFELVN